MRIIGNKIVVSGFCKFCKVELAVDKDDRLLRTINDRCFVVRCPICNADVSVSDKIVKDY